MSPWRRASTEPPIEIGGEKAKWLLHAPSLKKLQRSRRSRSAESGLSDVGDRERRRASTEPPIEIGGELHLAEKPLVVMRASTEPPIEIGGEARATAMTFFKDEASTEPPIEIGGEYRSGATIKAPKRRTLQRSRRSRSAESDPRAPRCVPTFVRASTEPPIEIGGERYVSRPVHPMKFWLQRSRRSRSAESSSVHAVGRTAR